MDPDVTAPLNRDPDYWRYRGRCRHCGFIEEWVVSREMAPDAYGRFEQYIRQHRFPAFLNFCEGCRAMVVFELLAYSSLEPPDVSEVR